MILSHLRHPHLGLRYRRSDYSLESAHRCAADLVSSRQVAVGSPYRQCPRHQQRRRSPIPRKWAILASGIYAYSATSIVSRAITTSLPFTVLCSPLSTSATASVSAPSTLRCRMMTLSSFPTLKALFSNAREFTGFARTRTRRLWRNGGKGEVCLMEGPP